MFGSRSLLGIAICVPLIGGCGSSDYDSYYLDEPGTHESEPSGPFVSTAGRFSVISPGRMIESQEAVQTAAGEIMMYLFMYETSSSARLVGYADYEKELVSRVDPEELLNGTRDGAVGNVNGILQKETRITIDGFPGRDLEFSAIIEAKVVSARARIYLVENRLYQILALEESSTGVSDEMIAFIDSFKLVE